LCFCFFFTFIEPCIVIYVCNKNQQNTLFVIKPVYAVWSIRLLIRMHERNDIKLYVKIFLRMNTWLFATCRRQCNWIQSLMEKVCILLVLVTYIHLSFVLCFMSSCPCYIRVLWSTNSSLKLYLSCTTFSFSAYGTTGMSFLFIYLQ
jgi:hypothetical protein